MRRPCLSPPAQCPDARRQSPRVAARTSPMPRTGRGDACVARRPIAARTMPGCATPIATHRRPHIADGPGPVGATHASPGGLSPPAQCPDARRQSPRVAARTSPMPRTGRGDACVARAYHRPHNARMRDANRHASPPAHRPMPRTGRGDACVARAYHRPHNARMRDANRHASPPAHRRCPGPVGATHASPLASTTVRTAPVAAPMATSRPHRRP